MYNSDLRRPVVGNSHNLLTLLTSSRIIHAVSYATCGYRAGAALGKWRAIRVRGGKLHDIGYVCSFDRLLSFVSYERTYSSTYSNERSWTRAAQQAGAFIGKASRERRQVRFDIGETYGRYRKPTTKHE